jgi:hypothetical protein
VDRAPWADCRRDGEPGVSVLVGFPANLTIAPIVGGPAVFLLARRCSRSPASIFNPAMTTSVLARKGPISVDVDDVVMSAGRSTSQRGQDPGMSSRVSGGDCGPAGCPLCLLGEARAYPAVRTASATARRCRPAGREDEVGN